MQWLNNVVLKSFLDDYSKFQTTRFIGGKDSCYCINGGRLYWIPRCTSDILYLSLSLPIDLSTKAMLSDACVDLMIGYFVLVQEGGSYPRGIYYWSNDMYYFIAMAERLLQATSGRFNLYEKSPMGGVLSYGYESMIQGDNSNLGKLYPLFGRNKNPTMRVPPILQLLEKRVETWFRDISTNSNVFYPFHNDIFYSPYRAETAKLNVPGLEPLSTFSGSGMMIIRDDSRALTYALLENKVPDKDGIGYTGYIHFLQLVGGCGRLSLEISGQLPKWNYGG